MNASLRMVLPAWIRAPLARARRLGRGFRHYWYDFRSFSAAAAGADNKRTRETDHALLVKHYHRLEKGLALPDPRPGFGADVVADVIDLVRTLEQADGPFFHAQGARATLNAYRASAVCTADLAQQIDSFMDGSTPDSLPAAGARLVSRAEIRAASSIDFAAFARSRHSVRDYSGEPVAETAIRQAVEIAMKSPRVCNRGTIRCHALFDRATMDKALSHQNGNAGFGHMAGAVLIITADRRGFLDYGERNQCWIDGGLFAMTLTYALHAMGYATCMLNWSVVSQKDKAFRQDIAIPPHEAIITLMAVGIMKDSFRVAVSPREGVDTAYRRIGPMPQPLPAQPRTPPSDDRAIRLARPHPRNQLEQPLPVDQKCEPGIEGHAQQGACNHPHQRKQAGVAQQDVHLVHQKRHQRGRKDRPPQRPDKID